MKREKSKSFFFIQGSLLLIVSNICIKAINFFLLPLYTKNLTPAMLGVSDSITTFTGILFPLLVMGLDSAYSAFYFEKKEVERAKKVFATLGIVFALLGIIPIFICLLAPQISLLLFNSKKYQILIVIALIGVSMNLWYLPFSIELRLRNRMGIFGFISVIASFSMILLNIIFVTIMKLGELSLVLSSAIVSGEQLLLFSINVKEHPKRKYFDIKLLKKMFAFAFPLIPSVLMAWILSLSDRYILLWYHGDTTVGLYGIGTRFVTFLNVIVNGITMAYTSFAFGSREDSDAKEKYYYIFNVVSILLLCISFTAAIFCKEIVTIMTDDAYFSSYIIIRDMMYGQTLYAMSTIISYGIIFEKKSAYSLLSVSAGAIVNLILNLIFIPRYGLVAASLTTLIGYSVSLIVGYYYSEKLYPCNYGISRIAITCMGTYVIAFITMEMRVSVRAIVWILVVVVCMVVYRDILKLIINLICGILKKTY